MEAFQRKSDAWVRRCLHWDHWVIPRNTHTRKRRHRLLGYCADDCRLQRTAAQEPAILISLLIGVSKWRSPRWLWNLSRWPGRNQLGKLCLMVWWEYWPTNFCSYKYPHWHHIMRTYAFEISVNNFGFIVMQIMKTLSNIHNLHPALKVL